LCQDMSSALYDDLRLMFQALVDAGGYRLDVDQVTRGFSAMIDGLWLDILISSKTIDRDDAKQTVRLFLAGLFPTEFGQRSAAAAQAASAA
ncbi:MAG: TetR family transcriptional regulator C-terminal domain-containing protein, partial [Dongiaceae bacterium]